ncbi:MAG: hypothetical protein ACAH89_01470 [Rariglobus sp.]|nr:hypothetical protein [Rariglobus sp.]
MKPLNCRALVLVFAVFASAVSSAFAQTPAPAAAPVEVATVKFRPVAGGWFEAEVEVQAKPGPVAVANRNFVNRVKVTFNLGVISVKAPQGATLPDTFYRASAEAVAIETTGRASFRFYLPPEIVKRDQVTGPQRFYLVELSVGGQALPLTKNDVPTNFTTAAFIEGFRSKVSGEASANDGILLPQYLTPFASGGTNTPSFIRTEGTR